MERQQALARELAIPLERCCRVSEDPREVIGNALPVGPAERAFVQGEGAVRDAPGWPPPDATPSTFYLSGEKSGQVRSLNDGSLVEDPPSAGGGETSWSYPDPMWMAGVTIFEDEVDNHWGMLFKAAILSTILSVGSEAGMSGNNNGSLAEAIRKGRRKASTRPASRWLAARSTSSRRSRSGLVFRCA